VDLRALDILVLSLENTSGNRLPIYLNKICFLQASTKYF
jgi:hypothetical protein